MHGVMGIANAQRSLNIMRTITEFISQDQYKDVIPMFGVVNEAQTSEIGIDTITSL
jgi:glucan 1,3-beta-glucosidase